MQNKQLEPIKLNMIKGGGKSVNLFAHISSRQEHYNIYHTHTFYEFIFIANGSVINRSEDEQTRLVKNDVLILKPEYPHQLIIDNNNNYLLYDLEVNSDFFKKEFNKENGIDLDELLINPITKLYASNNDAFEFVKLFNLSQRQTNGVKKEFYLKLLLTKFMTKLIVSLNTNTVNTLKFNYNIIYSMLEELNNIDNFALSIKQIAEKLNYSQEYIIRLFKNTNMDSPNKIFLKNKLNYAATLLVSSNMKIINIAELCGIYTIGYFNTAFKKEFNETPSRYRKKYTQNFIR